MDQNPQSHWRQMFERGRQDHLPGGNGGMPQANNMPSRQNAPMPTFGYDDGHDPARQGATAMSPQQVADEAAMSLAENTQEYRPWILQRGTRPLMMLHLRRFDTQAGHWLGWYVSYPALTAVEYVGERLLSLDFGARYFVIEGTGLSELARQLQIASVQAIVEFSTDTWAKRTDGAVIRGIRCIAR